MLYEVITQITYDWAPLEDRYMYYVGAAKKALEEGNVHLAAGLYPRITSYNVCYTKLLRFR